MRRSISWVVLTVLTGVLALLMEGLAAGAGPGAVGERVPSGCNGTPAATDARRNLPPGAVGPTTAPTVAPLAGPVPAQTAASTALLAHAVSDLSTMVSSRYTHRSLPFPDPTRVYDTDCSGFASFLVNQTSASASGATPGASFGPMVDLVARTTGRPVRTAGANQPRALADQFAELFGVLAEHLVGTDRYWAGYDTVDQLEPGDLVAWITNPGSTSSDTGHVMVAAGRPVLGPTIVHRGGPACPAGGPAGSEAAGSNYSYVCGRQTIHLYEYDVAIVDQSGPHGSGVVPDLNTTPPPQIAPGSDTRNANAKNGSTGTGKPHTGLGAGVLGLLTTAPGGTPVGEIWYPSGSTNPVFYVMPPAGRGAGCPAGSVVPRRQETTDLLTVHHLRCVPGIAFGELLVTG